MKFNELQVSKAKSRIRPGRGIAAGRGKTAGRGTKGQLSRSGKKLHPSFEGGQTPWIQKVPKNRGFKSKRLRPQVVYTDQLNKLDETIVDNAKLADAGLVKNPHNNVKLILRGEVAKKIEVKIQHATKGALGAVEKAGGKFTQTALIKKGKKDQVRKKD